MSFITWGMLSKSQEDSETIEEAITRIIQQHNENEESHLAEGQSLQSHKASEIIDHLIHSVKISNLEQNIFNKTVIASSFQSLDGCDVLSAETEFGLAGVWINTDTTINDLAYIAAKSTFGIPIKWDKNPVSEISVKFELGTDHDIIFGIGDSVLNNAGPFCGFKITNNILTANIFDENGSNEVSDTISGITLNDFNDYRIEFIDGVGAKFYINDNLKTTLNYTKSNPNIGRHFYLAMYNRTEGKHLEAFIKPFSYSEDK